MKILGDGINDLYAETLKTLQHNWVEEDSRNGPVLMIDQPVILENISPMNRVLYDPVRDANPYFHLMEALWMMAGANDVAWPKYFNKRFGEYSDDGFTIPGAYGHRWKKHFGADQIPSVINLLKRHKGTRRAVMTMWDPYLDLIRAYAGGKDVPCNTHIYFSERHDALDMTVCNRSNDLIWGALGSNAVHFSFLQEFIARECELAVGSYYQFTNNLHIYKSVPNFNHYVDEPYKIDAMLFTEHDSHEPFETYPIKRVPMVEWFEDLKLFMETPLNDSGYNDPFFPEVAVPIFRSWENRKTKVSSGLEELKQVKAQDWRYACEAWIKRRDNVSAQG